MTTKNVDVAVLTRDPEGNIIASQSATGVTEDEGETVVTSLGYVMNISSVPISDVFITLIPLPEIKPPAGVISRTDDIENGTSTLVFSY